MEKGTNPKDLIGAKKVDIAQVPPVALLHEAMAFMDGDAKYGYRNWRGNKVSAKIYISACMRHLNAWAEGEEIASDSGVHHLGHARACLGILLDAQETGSLLDDRVAGSFSKVAERLNDVVKSKSSEKKA